MIGSERSISRRDALKLGLAGSAALALPMERVARTQQAIANRIPESQLPAPFQVPFEAPKVLKPIKKARTADLYRITMQARQLKILPGFGPTTIFGYNGVAPGPTIVANRGRRTVVRFVNDLPASPFYADPSWTSVHLHGSDSLPQYDGYASDKTEPKQFKDYYYPNNQPARTLWYHDHGVHHTAENAYLGLAALYILHDRREMALPIPRGKYDVPLVLADKLFAQDGSLIFDDDDHSGLMGDVILVNGKPWPTMKVEPRLYRFRILNASISRSYRLKLSTDDELTVIGTDGGLMPSPQRTPELPIGMAERYEVVVDFSKLAGRQVILENLSNRNNVDYASTRQIMRFEVGDRVSDKRWNTVPDVLEPGTGEKYNPMNLQEAANLKSVELNLHRQNGEWKVNDTTWEDIERGKDGAGAFEWVEARAAKDEVQIWQLRNNSGGWFHPLHIHLIDFRILDRDGEPPHPWERGPKDVAYVGEGELIRVIAKFGPNDGRYMVHCHNLAHEDHDMMTQFEVGEGGPDPITAAPAKPIGQMKTLSATQPKPVAAKAGADTKRANERSTENDQPRNGGGDAPATETPEPAGDPPGTEPAGDPTSTEPADAAPENPGETTPEAAATARDRKPTGGNANGKPKGGNRKLGAGKPGAKEKRSGGAGRAKGAKAAPDKTGR